MAKQVEIPEAFADLFKPARNKAYYGGRGSGKSHSFAKALLLIGGQSRKRILCGLEVQKSIKDSVKQLLDDQIEQLGMQHFYQSLRDEIRGANGTQILFTGLSDLTIDQVKSFEGVEYSGLRKRRRSPKEALRRLSRQSESPAPNCGSRGIRGMRKTQLIRGSVVKSRRTRSSRR